MAGDITFVTGDGAIELLGERSSFEAFTGAAASVHVRHVVAWTNGTSAQAVTGPIGPGPVTLTTEPDQDEYDFTDATVRIEAADRPHEVWVRVRGGAGTLSAQFADAEFASLPHLYEAYEYDQATASAANAPSYAFADSVPGGALVVLRNDPLLADTSSVPTPRVPIAADGTVTMFVMGPRVVVDGAEGAFEASTGRVRRPVQDPAPYEERRMEFVVLEMSGAALAGAALDETLRLFAERARLALDGAMDLAGATGTLQPAGGRRGLADETVSLRGLMDVTLALDAVPEVDPPADGTVPVSADQGAVTTRGTIDGDYRIVTLNGQAVAAPQPGLTTAERTAAAVGLGALFLGALVAAKKFLLPALGLFARPEPLHPMLENPLRMRLHGLVSAYPGIHGRRLQSLAQVATGTFEHHMRSLLQANLVREERIGGRVVYVPSEPDAPKPKLDKDELAVRALLMTDARRRVAEAIAQAPRTQRELVDALGLPQQTVSFHVKALLDHKVIVASDGRPATYSVNPAYVDLITGAGALGEQQGILGRVLSRVRGSSPVEAGAAS